MFILSAIQEWINKTFGLKWFKDPTTDQIIYDREVKQLSYRELSKKYNRSKEEIKKIWYDYLGLSYLGRQYDLRNLPGWVNGLDVRPALTLLQAGFQNKLDVFNYIKGEPRKLLKLDNVGETFMKKIIEWLDN